jgi:PMP-22/EMP/MP20/Claudin tight junction
LHFDDIRFLISSFVAVFCAFWTGLSGCWKRSAGAITATAILMLVACLLAAGAMGLWHTVEFFEKEKVVGEEFYKQWDNVSWNNDDVVRTSD